MWLIAFCPGLRREDWYKNWILTWLATKTYLKPDWLENSFIICLLYQRKSYTLTSVVVQIYKAGVVQPFVGSFNKRLTLLFTSPTWTPPAVCYTIGLYMVFVAKPGHDLTIKIKCSLSLKLWSREWNNHREDFIHSTFRISHLRWRYEVKNENAFLTFEICSLTNQTQCSLFLEPYPTIDTIGEWGTGGLVDIGVRWLGQVGKSEGFWRGSEKLLEAGTEGQTEQNKNNRGSRWDSSNML